jgi:hypothetical protein
MEDVPTSTTAEWVNNQVYAIENLPVHDASFSHAEMQHIPVAAETFPELGGQPSYAFPGHVRDISYSPTGSTTFSSFPDVYSGMGYQMKSETPILPENSTPLLPQEVWTYGEMLYIWKSMLTWLSCRPGRLHLHLPPFPRQAAFVLCIEYHGWSKMGLKRVLMSS